jgi:hypothetical protein
MLTFNSIHILQFSFYTVILILLELVETLACKYTYHPFPGVLLHITMALLISIEMKDQHLRLNHAQTWPPT